MEQKRKTVFKDILAEVTKIEKSFINEIVVSAPLVL